MGRRLLLALAVFLAAPAVLQAQRVADGLVVLYLFQEGQGTVVGDSGPGEPLDLDIDPFDLGNLVEWIPGGGLSVNRGTGFGPDGGTLIRSFEAATKVFDAIAGPGGTSALSIELWVTPELPNLQVNISRMFTMSLDPSNRNFTLGTTELGDQYVHRLRTPATGNNGTAGPGQLVTGGDRSVVAGKIQHVVFTRDSDGVEKIHVDKDVRAMRTLAPLDDLAGWDPFYSLGLGDEFVDGGRKFNGEYYLVAVYDRPLEEDEVSRNFSAANPADRVTEGLVVQYLFDEGQGLVVGDSGPGEPLDLEIDPVDLGTRVEWIPGGGLSMNLGSGPQGAGGATPVQSLGPATKIFDAIAGPTGSSELTIEVRVRPELPDLQSNISRIVTYSESPRNRNFTLGTVTTGDQYVNRLRTVETGNNGAGPPGGQLITTGGRTVIAEERQHVLFTRDADGVENLYVDGSLRAGPRTVTGTFVHPVRSFQEMEDLINDVGPYAGRATATMPLAVADFRDTANDGHFGVNLPVPGTAGGNNDDFAIEITGTLDVLQAGTYTFVYSGDDGGQIQIDFNDGAGLVDVIFDPGAPHAVEDWGGVVQFPAAGNYDFRLAGYERGGGAAFEWMYASEDRSADFTDGAFNVAQLGGIPIGDNVPDPNPGPWYLIGNDLPDLQNPGNFLIQVADGATVTAYHSPESASPTELANWDPTFPLGLGNEMSLNRKFNGDYHLAAVYSRALSADEVSQNFRAGPGGTPVEICNNTIDDDNDGLADCADPDCSGHPNCQAQRFIRGNVDAQGSINISDPIFLLSWLFQGGAEPECLESGNVDGQGTINISDPIYLLSWLFQGGPPPPAPFPDCGRPDPDPGPELIDCNAFGTLCP